MLVPLSYHHVHQAARYVHKLLHLLAAGVGLDSWTLQGQALSLLLADVGGDGELVPHAAVHLYHQGNHLVGGELRVPRWQGLVVDAVWVATAFP